MGDKMIIIFKKVYLWILLLGFILLVEFGIFDGFIHLFLSKYYFLKGERTVKSSFVHLRIPSNWFLSYQDEMLTKLNGPPLNRYTNQYMTTFKDENESIKNYFYMEPEFCQSKATIMHISNKVFLHDEKNIKSSEFGSKIIFCEKPEFGEPYAALFNKGIMSVVVIKPYQKENQNTYVILFKSLKFDAYIHELPAWLNNKSGK